MDFELPEELPVIKNYEVLHKIHGGGMGIVYRARHKGSGRTEAAHTRCPARPACPATRCGPGRPAGSAAPRCARWIPGGAARAAARRSG